MADTGKVNIHGKEYETVASRVQRFRNLYTTQYSLITEIVDRDEEAVVVKATIKEGERIIATGHAEEKRSSSQINRTSALENAETSAIGRALAAFGMAGTEFASADEVANAIHQQKAPVKPAVGAEPLLTETQKAQIRAFTKGLGVEREDIPEYLREFHGITDHTQMTMAEAARVIKEMQ